MKAMQERVEVSRMEDRGKYRRSGHRMVSTGGNIDA
jgi:hypothetical protein